MELGRALGIYLRKNKAFAKALQARQLLAPFKIPPLEGRPIGVVPVDLNWLRSA